MTTIISSVLLAALAMLVGIIFARGSYDLQGLVLVFLALIIIVVFILIPKMSADEGKIFYHLLILAFFAKAGASMFRFVWGFDVKAGNIDAGRYHGTGQVIAQDLWHWDFESLFFYLARSGTQFIEGLTGIVYAIIGPTVYGGFLFFAFLTFLGSCLHYKAFRLAFPAGNRLIYAGLILFYPSWLYWPSSIGKDSTLAFLIGITSFGIVVLLRKNLVYGLILVAIGLGGVYMIRTHIAAFIGAGLIAALIFRRYRLGPWGPLVTIATVAVALFIGWQIVGRAASFVGAGGLSIAAGLETYEAIQGRARGGAYFEPVSITEPLGVPMAIITVLFRPFPWEAHRGAALILSFEGVFLLCLTIYRYRSLKAVFTSVRSDPFLIFILLYAGLSALAFTSFGNFSILGRQRLQFLPFFFMLLAYPNASEKKKAVGIPDAKGDGVIHRQRFSSPANGYGGLK